MGWGGRPRIGLTDLPPSCCLAVYQYHKNVSFFLMGRRHLSVVDGCIIEYSSHEAVCGLRYMKTIDASQSEA